MFAPQILAYPMQQPAISQGLPATAFRGQVPNPAYIPYGSPYNAFYGGYNQPAAYPVQNNFNYVGTPNTNSYTQVGYNFAAYPNSVVSPQIGFNYVGAPQSPAFVQQAFYYGAQPQAYSQTPSYSNPNKYGYNAEGQTWGNNPYFGQPQNYGQNYGIRNPLSPLGQLGSPLSWGANSPLSIDASQATVSNWLPL